MRNRYTAQSIFLSPTRCLLNIRLPREIVVDAFSTLYRQGAVVRITHQDESGNTNVLFTRGARKKVEKILVRLRKEYFSGDAGLPVTLSEVSRSRAA